MDNPFYEYSGLPQRPPLVWPRNEPLAVCIIVSLDHMDWLPSPRLFAPATTGMQFSHSPPPDVRPYSQREYGLRVGVFRVMDVLDELGVRASVAIDASTAANYPFVVDECKRRGWEFICHGRASNDVISSGMTAQEELSYIRSSIEAVSRATGGVPSGWLGAEYGESRRTPDLLAQCGIRYVCDWPNDEQPYRLRVKSGSLVSLPMLLDSDDVISHFVRHVPIMRYARIVTETFDSLRDAGRVNGRLMLMNVHPWLIGQPFRIRYFAEALRHMTARADVWFATTNEVATWFDDPSRAAPLTSH